MFNVHSHNAPHNTHTHTHTHTHTRTHSDYSRTLASTQQRRIKRYNPFFVDQVAAMEERAKAVGAPPLHYMFPDNGGMNADDIAKFLALGLPAERYMPGPCGRGCAPSKTACASFYSKPRHLLITGASLITTVVHTWHIASSIHRSSRRRWWCSGRSTG